MSITGMKLWCWVTSLSIHDPKPNGLASLCPWSHYTSTFRLLSISNLSNWPFKILDFIRGFQSTSYCEHTGGHLDFPLWILRAISVSTSAIPWAAKETTCPCFSGFASPLLFCLLGLFFSFCFGSSFTFLADKTTSHFEKYFHHACRRRNMHLSYLTGDTLNCNAGSNLLRKGFKRWVSK